MSTKTGRPEKKSPSAVKAAKTGSEKNNTGVSSGRAAAAEQTARAASGVKTARRIILLLLAALLVGMLFIFREDITPENIGYLLSYFDLRDGSRTHERMIHFDAAPENRIAEYKGHMALLSGRSLCLYDQAGKPTLEAAVSHAEPAIESGKKHLLVYGAGDRDIQLYSTYGEVFSKTFDYPVLDANINDKGAFAVVTSDRDILSCAVVYDKSFNELYRLSFRDQYMVSAAISGDGTQLAALTVNAEGGDMVSTLWICDLKKQEPLFEKKYTGEMALRVRFIGDSVFTVTDRNARFTAEKEDESGILFAETVFSFDGRVLRFFDIGESGAVFALSDGEYGRIRLHALDAAGKKLYTVDASKDIRCAALCGKYMIVGHENGADLYSSSGLAGSIEEIRPVLSVVEAERDRVLIAGANTASFYRPDDIVKAGKTEKEGENQA